MLSRRLQSGWGVSFFSWYEVFVCLITILGEEGFVVGGEIVCFARGDSLFELSSGN